MGTMTMTQVRVDKPEASGTPTFMLCRKLLLHSHAQSALKCTARWP